jgi:hypothetical protein
VVKGFGFHQNEEEACVYKKESGSVVVFLILYVDDILLIDAVAEPPELFQLKCPSRTLKGSNTLKQE